MPLELVDMRDTRPPSGASKGPRRPGAQQDRRHHTRSLKYDVEGFHAYCSSDRCCNQWGKNKNGHNVVVSRKERVVKEVELGTRECPDCHLTLFWKNTVTKTH